MSAQGQTILQPPGLSAADTANFGHSVAIDGDFAVAGAYSADGAFANEGAASAFRWNGSAWQFVETLHSPTPSPDNQYGYDIALSGSTLAIGDYTDSAGLANAGAVHLYTWNSGAWSFQQTVQASVLQSWSAFGLSVALEGDTLVVGAHSANGNIGAVYVFKRSGVVWTETQTLTPSDGDSGDLFGVDVAIDGNYIVVGAIGADGVQPSSGAAYVFSRPFENGTFSQQARIISSSPTDVNNFGHSVAITTENTILVGDPNDSTLGDLTGAAYIFTRNNTIWTQQQKLTASDAGGLGFKDFGFSVALSVDSAAIGAIRNQGEGSAYIFVRDGDTWTESVRYDNPPGSSGSGRFGYGVDIWRDRAIVGGPQLAYSSNFNGLAAIYEPVGAAYTGPGQQVEAGLLEQYAQFGYSVDVDGDYAVVGAIGGNSPYLSAGDAYVLHWNGASWEIEDHLQPFDGDLADQFGCSVGISGDTIAVGARFDDDSFQTSGSVYVYTRSGTVWGLQQKLTASDPGQFDKFGTDVGIDGDSIVVGAPEDDDLGSNTGSAYVFVRDGGGVWTEQGKLNAGGLTASSDQFGASVAISGDSVIVGAPNHDPSGFSQGGSAYVFTRSGGLWTQQQEFTASDANHLSFFGKSVDIDGDYAIVGTLPGINEDAAYVFHRIGGAWTEQQRLTSPEAGRDRFGSSVSISGIFALVGAEFAFGDKGVKGGGAYLFTRSGTSWNADPILQPSNLNTDDAFGHDVAIGGNAYGIGMPFDDTLQGVNTGSAVLGVIPLPSPDLTGDSTVDGSDLGLLLSAWGGAGSAAADLNVDGVVNGADLGLLLSEWGPVN